MTVYSDKKHCCGCAACSNACPKQAIRMIPDAEGFLYPVIDGQKCVSCGLCQKVCPYKRNADLRQVQSEAYAYKHKDANLVENSSSGGAFSGLCDTFCSGEYFVAGAAFNKTQRVVHKMVDSLDACSIFQKSKYVQSDMDGIHVQVQKALSEGKRVLFSGTPCQCESILSYLGGSHENLLTVDLICHGVPSPLFFQKYIRYLEGRYQGQLVKYDFRNKRAGWESSELLAEFNNGKKYRNSTYANDDPYMIAFIKRMANRPSCSVCPFACLNRKTDFTLGDLWGADEILPEWNDNKGLSVMLVHTEKARSLLQTMYQNAKIREIPIESIANHNKNLVCASENSPVRDAFMKDLISLPFPRLIKKYLKPRSVLRRSVSKLFNKKTKTRIKKILKI